MADKKIIAVTGATGSQGGGLVRAILGDPNGGFAARAIKYIPADKITLSSDCGMKPLARMVAKMKLHALTEGAAIVRKEVAGK